MIRLQTAINTFSGGMDMDTSVNKYPNTCYFDAVNLEIISEDSLNTASVTNVKGNVLKLTFDTGDKIIGHCKIRNNFNDSDKDSIVFFAVNSSSPTSRIYLLEADMKRLSTVNMSGAFATVGSGPTAYKAGYIYRSDDLNFNEAYPIKAEGRYESANIRKVYWVDGNNNFKYMIVDRVSNTDPVTIFDVNPTAELISPTATVEVGGGYTSGLVQYAYQLYVRNGARTTFSSCSNLVYLTGGDSDSTSIGHTGTNLNVNTGKSVNVNFTNLDTNYSRIRIVSIHYKEDVVNPTINIVGELEYSNSTLSFIDNGFTNYGTIPIEEFRLVGQLDHIADSITSKDNILFLGNIKEKKWNPSWLDPNHISFWDSRAVRFKRISIPFVGDTDTGENFSKGTYGVDMIYISNNTIEVTVPDISGKTPDYFELPAGAILTDITFVGVDIGPTAVSGTHSSGTPFSSSTGDTNFTNITYTSETDTLTFRATNTAGNYFSGAVTIDDASSVFDLLFIFDYDAASGSSVLKDNSEPDVTISNIVSDWSNYDYDHDGINEYNDIKNDGDTAYEYKFKSDGIALGAEGLNVTVDFVTEDIKIDDNSDPYVPSISTPFSGSVIDTFKRTSIREEVYRLYIVFFNTKMQYSNPQWICDLRIPTNSDITTIPTADVGRYIFPKVTISNLPSDSELLGWQIYRCERKPQDRSILARGVIAPTFNFGPGTYARPYIQSTFDSVSGMLIRAQDSGISRYLNLLEMISPESLFYKNINCITGDKIRIEGRYSAAVTVSTTWNTARSKLKISSTGARHSGETSLTTVNDCKIEPIRYQTPIDIQFNSLTYRNVIAHVVSSPTYVGQKGSTFIVGTSSNIPVDIGTDGLILGSYVRDVFNIQYNGNTFESRSYNQVIPYSEYIPKATSNVTCYKGDGFISYFTHLRSMVPSDYSTTHKCIQAVHLGVESTINCNYRLDPAQKYIDGVSGKFELQELESDGIAKYPSAYPTDVGNLYRYNKVYSSSANANLIQCQIFDSNNISSNDVQIIATGKKLNNEYFDNWTNLYLNNTIEVDPKYGPIRNIFTYQDKLFCGQDKAISLIAVNDRSVVTDMNRSKLVLGTGAVLERYDYLTTSSGFQGFNDVVLGDKSFYYIDRSNKIIYMFTGEGDVPISEVNGIKSLLKSYTSINNVKTGYDSQKKRVFFYVSDGSSKNNTIVYDEYQRVFLGRQSFTPDWIFPLNHSFYSIKDNECYLHNEGVRGEFYGVLDNTSIDLIINPNGELVNSYDVLELRSDVYDSTEALLNNETFNTLETSNTYLTFTKPLSIDNTIQKISRKWRTWLLPEDVGLEIYRMVDTYVRAKLTYQNNNNKKIVLYDVMTHYRPTKT